MHRLILAALAGACAFILAEGAAAQAIKPFTSPAECNSASSSAACQAALKAMLANEPDNHLARLRLADSHYHADDLASMVVDIQAVRGSVSPEQFEVLLAAQNDFMMVGEPTCRLIVHKSQAEWQWRGPCANGDADGRGTIIGIEGRTATTRVATVKGGVFAADGVAWGVQQTVGGFEYYRMAPGARTRPIGLEQAPADVREFLTQVQQTLSSRLVRGEVNNVISADNVKLANGWPRHCYLYRSVGTERHQLTVRTPGRQAWVGIQPGNNCGSANWIPGYGGPGGAERTAPGGADTVSLDVVLGPGVYVVGVAGGAQPGPFKYTREQLPIGGGIGLGKGAADPPPANPSGQASTATFKSDRAYRPGEVIKDCPTCPEVVVVPAGSFMLGSPATEEGREGAEGPRKQVTFKRPFGIGRTEVTFDEWNACVAAGVCQAKADNGWGQGRRPVINVGYDDARAYLGWLTKTTGYNYYLPSESEWEYAARAGTDTPWNTGEGIITDDANILNAFGRTVPVAGFPANAWGLHDMHGNVYEYVQDCYEVGYFETPNDGRAKVGGKCIGVMRGGSYLSEPALVRSAARMQAGAPGPTQGFRVTRLLD